MPLTVRSATLHDLPAILAIELQAAHAAHWTSQRYKELLDSGLVLVAEQTGKTCGFVCVKAVAGEWEIENVVVAAEYLRRGIADALVRELIRRATSDAATMLVLEVRESNLPARQLYEKHGFCKMGRRRVYYQDPAEDAVLYGLRFDR